MGRLRFTLGPDFSPKTPSLFPEFDRTAAMDETPPRAEHSCTRHDELPDYQIGHVLFSTFAHFC